MSNNPVRRSFICTSAITTSRYLASHQCGADVGLVDLEDSVPAPHKRQARVDAEIYFSMTADSSAHAFAVRINSTDSPEGLADLYALAEYQRKPDIVIVPMVEASADLDIAADILDTESYVPELYAVVETPLGVSRLTSIIEARRLDGLIFGAADYASATGAELRWSTMIFARSAIVNAASSIGLPAIDSPFFGVHDKQGLRRESRLAKALGYSGKIALHPGQVPIINTAFSPSKKELAQAHAIVQAGANADAGIGSVDGQMVGPPFYAAAQAILGRVNGDES